MKRAKRPVAIVALSLWATVVVPLACATIAGEQNLPSEPGVDAGHTDTKRPDSGHPDANRDGTVGQSSGCEIGAVHYGPGATNPGTLCGTCQPSLTKSAWSPANEGSTCGSGEVCHAGACEGGCGISGQYYGESEPNPNNPCQVCLPGTLAHMWSNVTDGTSCGQNHQICSGGQCGVTCDIGGVIFDAGAAKPNNGCQICQPGTSNTQWTGLVPGAVCASGEVCSGDGGPCASGCSIGGAFVPPGTRNGDPNGICQTCKPGPTTTTMWTNTPGANASCAMDGGVCNGTSPGCVPGCYLATTGFVQPDASNPDNPCQNCQPAFSTTGWSTNGVTEGMPCGNGLNCSHGACGTVCNIADAGAGDGGVPTGMPNPRNICQSCQPGTSTTRWSNDHNGTICGDAAICVDGGCGAQCDVDAGIVNQGALNPSNPCQICLPGTTTTTWTTEPNGTACGDGSVCVQNGSCQPGCFIGGMLVPLTMKDPNDPCESCEPGNAAQWTAEPDGVPMPACPDATAGKFEVCHQGQCTVGCYINGGFKAPGTPETPNGCYFCQPGSPAANSTTTWTFALTEVSCMANGVTGACNATTQNCF